MQQHRKTEMEEALEELQKLVNLKIALFCMTHGFRDCAQSWLQQKLPQ